MAMTSSSAPVNDVFVNFLPVFRVSLCSDSGRDVSQTSSSHVDGTPYSNYKPH